MGMAELARLKELTGGQERNHLNRATRNGVWISGIPQQLNSTEFSKEEFQDNLCVRYGLMHQDILVTCGDCGKKFSIEQNLLC